jgi:hypothetical protein
MLLQLCSASVGKPLFAAAADVQMCRVSALCCISDVASAICAVFVSAAAAILPSAALSSWLHAAVMHLLQ